MTDVRAARPSARGLVWACAGSVGAALLLWLGSVAVWFRLPAVPAELTGAQLSAGPGGVALLALAGVAAVVATGGWARRAVGVVLALAGAAVGSVVGQVLGRGPAASGATLPGSGRPVPPDQPVDPTAAPLLALAGAVVLLAVGVFVLLREPELSRLGARYAAPREPRAEPDPDRAAWSELDAGRDPTTDGPGGGRDGPGVGGTGRAV